MQGAGICWIDFFIIYISFALFICACISNEWSIKTGPDKREVGFQVGDQESLLMGGGFDHDLGRCLGLWLVGIYIERTAQAEQGTGIGHVPGAPCITRWHLGRNVGGGIGGDMGVRLLGASTVKERLSIIL